MSPNLAPAQRQRARTPPGTQAPHPATANPPTRPHERRSLAAPRGTLHYMRTHRRAWLCRRNRGPRRRTSLNAWLWREFDRGGWPLPSPRGTRWDTDNFSAALREANAAAGLAWTSLDYRHTFGSLLAHRGVSLFQIATLMGNSPEICRRHYAAMVPETMAGFVDF